MGRNAFAKMGFSRGEGGSFRGDRRSCSLGQRTAATRKHVAVGGINKVAGIFFSHLAAATLVLIILSAL